MLSQVRPQTEMLNHGKSFRFHAAKPFELIVYRLLLKADAATGCCNLSTPGSSPTLQQSHVHGYESWQQCQAE